MGINIEGEDVKRIYRSLSFHIKEMERENEYIQQHGGPKKEKHDLLPYKALRARAGNEAYSR